MHLVVDGYNVMHALPVDREWPGATFQDRRVNFLDRLAAYASGRPHRITVVFDGAKGGDGMGGAETRGHIQVRYSPRGVEADDLIRRMIEESPRPSDLLVVSSDKAISGIARSRGASTARGDELANRLLARPRETDRTAGDLIEERVKGVLPQAPRRSAPRGRSAQALW